MKFGSVCSGIEAASVAWNPLGWRAQWLAEIEPFPCSVLAHHYPDTPNLGDMTKFNDWPTDDKHSIDLLCGGTPCQSFSVAGLRKGLDDPRGNLMVTFGAIAAKYRPRWLVWENVPGVLSSNGGRDFGSFLGLLGVLGYGFAYRILDAQYFGLAQRRRRVFVVGCLGDWRSAAAVLFERHSMQGHPAPSRQAGQAITPTIRAGAANGGAGHGARSGDSKDELIVPVAGTMKACKDSGGWTNSADHAAAGYMIPVPHSAISPALKARDSKGPSSDGDGDGAILVPMLSHALRGEGFDASEDGTGRGTPLVPIAFTMDINKSDNMGSSQGVQVEHSNTLRTDKVHAVIRGMQVRRLTPVECERLQGFPDNYTNIPHRGKPAADGPRYKALGNSWAVPNVRWIGRRIDMVDAITQQEK